MCPTRSSVMDKLSDTDTGIGTSTCTIIVGSTSTGIGTGRCIVRYTCTDTGTGTSIDRHRSKYRYKNTYTYK